MIMSQPRELVPSAVQRSVFDGNRTSELSGAVFFFLLSIFPWPPPCCYTSSISFRFTVCIFLKPMYLFILARPLITGPHLWWVGPTVRLWWHRLPIMLAALGGAQASGCVDFCSCSSLGPRTQAQPSWLMGLRLLLACGIFRDQE